MTPTMLLHLPNNTPKSIALPRTTHLGIGAHQDDLEFMAFHGIAQCYQSSEQWFTGITCTNGAGSPRTGSFAHYSGDEMQALRQAEQNEAANLGNYSAQYQLGHSSSALQQDEQRDPISQEIAQIIKETSPNVIYTHNPVDKHPTHLAVFSATLRALRSLPVAEQPSTFLGCEVWRDLDWLPDEKKVALDVSTYPDLAARLNLVFQSQIAGGKNYHEAIIGRRKAHATFSSPHTVDQASQISFAVDLMPLVHNPSLTASEFVTDLIHSFQKEVSEALNSNNF